MIRNKEKQVTFITPPPAPPTHTYTRMLLGITPPPLKGRSKSSHREGTNDKLNNASSPEQTLASLEKSRNASGNMSSVKKTLVKPQKSRSPEP